MDIRQAEPEQVASDYQREYNVDRRVTALEISTCFYLADISDPSGPVANHLPRTACRELLVEYFLSGTSCPGLPVRDFLSGTVSPELPSKCYPQFLWITLWMKCERDPETSVV